jgi:hypothetical protein
MKFTVDCFTEEWVGTRFPVNSYDAESVEEVARIVHNCSRKIAGIKQVQVWIDEPHHEESK